MSGLVGCTRTRAICCVSARPRNVQVLPPSVVFHTPSPCDTLPRIGNSPVPTYTMSCFDSETPIAPIGPPKYLSVTGSHVLPPSVLLKTPPPVVPNQYSLGRAAEPATATLRPPRARDRKSTRLNSSHVSISYAVFCLKKKKKKIQLSRSSAVHAINLETHTTELETIRVVVR